MKETREILADEVYSIVTALVVPGCEAEAKQRITRLIAEKVAEARVEGIKLVDEALLDDITGTYPVAVVRNLIKLLVWENSSSTERASLRQEK